MQTLEADLSTPEFEPELYSGHYEYYGRDLKTHIVTRENDVEGQRALEESLKKHRRQHESETALESEVDDQMHDAVLLSSAIVKNTDGSSGKVFIMLHKNTRKIVTEAPKKSNIFAWWG